MSIAQSFIRALDNKGSIYLPYAFSGEWSEAEEAIMAAAIDPHVPEKVDAMFNNWRFRLDEGRRYAGGHSYHQRSETNDDQ